MTRQKISVLTKLAQLTDERGQDGWILGGGGGCKSSTRRGQ